MWGNEGKKKGKKREKRIQMWTCNGWKERRRRKCDKRKKEKWKAFGVWRDNTKYWVPKIHLIVKLPCNSTQVLENISNLFLVSVTYYSLWWELSDENKIWKHIQTSYYSVRPNALCCHIKQRKHFSFFLLSHLLLLLSFHLVKFTSGYFFFPSHLLLL